MKFSIAKIEDAKRKIAEDRLKFDSAIDSEIKQKIMRDVDAAENLLKDIISCEPVEMKREDETRMPQHYTFYILTEDQESALDEGFVETYFQ